MSDTVRARRSDLVMVEMRPSDGRGHVVEKPEFKLMTVSNLTRDGQIKMVRDDRWGEQGTPQQFDGMLYRTGRFWLLPAADWDVSEAQRIAREHTYPNSTTPMCWRSLESAREALRPARRGN